jgi:hypothetical protein
VRSGVLGDFFRRTGGDNLATAAAAFRAQVHDPVGGFDDIEVVLDDHHGVAVIAQAMEHLQQLRMSSKCRPVVGSSRMYSVRPVSRFESSRAA